MESRFADGGADEEEGVIRTNEGRKMNLPSNLHGYSSSRPLRSPTARSDDGDCIWSNDGSVGHWNAFKKEEDADVEVETEDGKRNVLPL